MTSVNANTVREAVTTAINTAQTDGSLTGAVVKVLADREIKRRTDLLVQGVDKLEAAQKSLSQVDKPDNVLVDASGAQVQFKTAKRVQEIASAKKKVDNLTQAINGAITQANFDGLEKALKQGDGKPAPAEEAET